jgi:chromosome segregation ATPase
MSIISQDSENTNSRESKDLDLSAKEHGKELYQIQDEMDQCLVKIEKVEGELSKIRDAIASKTVEGEIASKNQGMREKQVELKNLEVLYGRTKNGPDAIKNDKGETSHKRCNAKKINEKMKEVSKEFGKLEQESWPLGAEKAKLTREISGLIKNEQDMIKQLDGEYVKLERQTKTLEEKENKQFESELSSTASTRDTNSLNSSKLKVNLDKVHDGVEWELQPRKYNQGVNKILEQHGKNHSNETHVQHEKDHRLSHTGPSGRGM